MRLSIQKSQNENAGKRRIQVQCQDEYGSWPVVNEGYVRKFKFVFKIDVYGQKLSTWMCACVTHTKSQN